MSAILIAAGRGVTTGEPLGSIRNVDVAPTVLSLLGVPVPDWMDGSPIQGLVGAAPGALAAVGAMAESPQ